MWTFSPATAQKDLNVSGQKRRFNPLTPNDRYSGRTAPLTSNNNIFIQQIQVLNILNMVYTLRFFSLQNAVCFIILTYLVPLLFTFYTQSVLKLKKNNNSGAKRLNKVLTRDFVVWIYQAVPIKSSLCKQPTKIIASIASTCSLDAALPLFS